MRTRFRPRMRTLSPRPSSPLGIVRFSPLFGLVLTLLIAAPAAGQTPAPTAAPDTVALVDRVVAVVGDSIILLTELQQEYAIARGEDSTVTQQEVLDEIINMMLIVQAAARDSTIAPTDAE